METRFYVLFAAPGVEPPNEWPGKESMGTDLVARFALSSAEAVWLIAQDMPAPEANERYYQAMKDGVLRTDSLPPEAFDSEGVIRGYLFGTGQGGIAFYIDLHVPHLVHATSSRDDAR